MRLKRELGATLLLTLGGVCAAEGIVWTSAGEPGVGGAIVAVEVSPHDSRHLVATGDMLGATVSFDGGDSWDPSFGFPSDEMCEPTFHPTEPKTVWLGTCMGPFKSTDGGRNWVSKREGMPALTSGGYSAIVQKILFDPKQPKRLLAFGGSPREWLKADTFGWIWESLDDGESWAHIGTFTSEGLTPEKKKGLGIRDATYDPQGTTLYARVAKLGWMTSADGGKTWGKFETSGIKGGISGLAFHPTDPSILWASTWNYKTGEEDKTREPGGVFKSTDGGKTFFAIDGSIKKVNERNKNENLTTAFANIIVSPANPDVLYVCDQAWNNGVIYKSADGGTSWNPVATRGGIGIKSSTPGERVCVVETATFAGLALRLVADPQDANRTYGFNSGNYSGSRPDAGGYLKYVGVEPGPPHGSGVTRCRTSARRECRGRRAAGRPAR